MTSLLIPHVRRHEPRAPASVKQTSSGSYLLDFTFNQAMQCTLRIETDGSHAGTTLRLHHGEQADATGSLVISNDLGSVEDRTTFILSDAVGVQTFETQFAYFGARFVDIAGWPKDSQPTTDSMTCYFVHTALPRLSQVRVSSTDDTAQILNGIHDITMRSALSNFMSTPTDCPSREKRGWTGDGQAAAETLIYNFDMSTAYPKWLGDIADAQQCNFHDPSHEKCPAADPWCRSPSGLDGSVVPEITPLLFGPLDGCAGGSDPAWGSGFIAIIDWVHRYYGDRQVLAQHYGGGAAYLDVLLKQVNTSVGGSSLLDLHYSTTRYGDWCAPLPVGTALQPNNTARHTSNLCVFVPSVSAAGLPLTIALSRRINGFYWLKQLRIMADAAATLGKTADAQKFTQLASAGAESYNRLYFDRSQGQYKDIECTSDDDPRPCHAVSRDGGKATAHSASDGELSVQTAQCLPLFLGLPTTAADRKRVGDALANDVTHGVYPGRTTTGLVGTKYVLGELVDAGHADVALTVASAMDYPSWGRMLPPSVHPDGQGEGTLWEQFGGDEHHGHGSRNHIMLGGFDGPYFYGRLAGIRNAGLGWNRVLIAPTGPSADWRRLTGVAATVGTVRGDITVEWSGNADICSEGHEDGEVCLQPAVLNCSSSGGVIEAISFANYGTSTGTCGSYLKNCSGDNSLAVVEKRCLGKSACVVNASATTFAHNGAPYDPCPMIPKTLTVQAKCSALFSMHVTLPVGVDMAEVRLPLGAATTESVSVTESGSTIWRGGKFVPGVSGVVSVAPFESAAGRTLSVSVQSGSFAFSVLNTTSET
jgi:alpha-L-rhamnosidase